MTAAATRPFPKAPMSRPAAIVLLLLCTTFWGFAFVVQKTAMESMGPLTFLGTRYLLGGLVIVPLALLERRRQTIHLSRGQWLFTALMALAFFLGSWLQQAGLL
ncbi:MAG TPA: DMT family transporter, partial [Devosia sp.]|nr:DMT family transporter [Devosia sp.]